MGVMLQAFYWNCPTEEGCAGGWWARVTAALPALKRAGFTAVWLPPASKAASTASMGYDVYDYWDLGEHDQRGGRATLFGSRRDLDALIAAAHAAPAMQVYADLVLNHNSGADAQEENPVDGALRWTRFTPASGQFGRDWTDFHPCAFESWDGYERCGEMPDLCHRNPRVYAELLRYARWLVEEVGFDGFRYDMVKGYGAWIIGAVQEYRYRLQAGRYFKPFGVGEYWDSGESIAAWLRQANIENDNPASAFDFVLRDRLKHLCDTFGWDLRGLAEPGALFRELPERAVTFVENHDLAEPHEDPHPVVNDKMLAYAFILTHEGYPCVFWKDWFGCGLGLEGEPGGIAALVGVHERLAGGPTDVLHVDHDVYVMQRRGSGDQPGLVLVLNNRGDGWAGRRVRCAWPDRELVPAAWRGRDGPARPVSKRTDGAGWVELWAPPRGYAVYHPV